MVGPDQAGSRCDVSGHPVDVLVVGAGPTGLALALEAHDHGARVRILERRAEFFRPSRAMMMHPRTLELLRPLGVTDALLQRGLSSVSVHIHFGSRVVVLNSDALDLRNTAFQHLLVIRQTDVEDVLAQALDERGIRVERGSEVVDVQRQGGHRAVVQRGDGVEEITYRFLVGSDGADGLIRSYVGGWRGKEYRQEVILADLKIRGEEALQPGAAHVVAGRRGLLFLFPIGERAPWRLLATRPVGVSRRWSELPEEPVPREELQTLVNDAKLPVAITEVAWSRSIRLQHRLATRFRRGPIFIAGDAAHAHSPAGGQGMNMGIHDAVNLGWKLAFAAQADGPLPKLLDSYHRERRPADHRVLWMTHVIFWAEASDHPLAEFARAVLAPRGVPFIPWMTRRRSLMHLVARTLAQFRVHYGHSPLAVGRGLPRLAARQSVWRTRAGARLPDIPVVCDGLSVLLHSLLAKPGVHVLLERNSDDIDLRLGYAFVTVHRLSDQQGAGVVIARPDGYVGYRSNVVDHRDLERWFRMAGVPPRTGSRTRTGLSSR